MPRADSQWFLTLGLDGKATDFVMSRLTQFGTKHLLLVFTSVGHETSGETFRSPFCLNAETSSPEVVSSLISTSCFTVISSLDERRYRHFNNLSYFLLLSPDYLVFLISLELIV